MNGIQVVWHACVFMPFTDISGLAQLWSQSCDTFALVQHPADGKTKRIHCHMLLGNCKIKPDSLHAQRLKMGITTPRISWISEKVQKGEFKGKEYTVDQLLKYMLKGKHNPLVLKNISQDLVQTSVNDWIEPSIKSTDTADKKPDTQTHYQVCQEIIKTAKSTHPEWFRVAITNYFADDEDEFTLRPEYHRSIWDLMIKELNVRKIRCSINELERFYTTIMRNDIETKHLLFQNYWRKIKV